MDAVLLLARLVPAGLSVGERWAALGLVLAYAALATGGWATLHLLRQNGRLLLRLEAIESRAGRAPAAPAPRPPSLPAGAPAPRFALPDLDGGTVDLDRLLANDRPALLVFTDPNCGPCAALMPDLGRWQRPPTQRVPALATVAVVARGSAEANRAKAAEHGLARLLLQDGSVSKAYGVTATPAAVVVRTDGTVGGPPAVGVAAIRALAAEVLGPPATGPAVGADDVPPDPEAAARCLEACLARGGGAACRLLCDDSAVAV